MDGLPNLSGSEDLIERTIAAARDRPVFLDDSRIPFDRIRSACAIALHMHQPLTPTGGDDLRTAALIGNLQTMLEHPGIGDNHNAPVFRHCYARMGEFIPALLAEGHEPRVMLEYSGTLLHGLRLMGADDVIDSLKRITCDAGVPPRVEWLGAPWGHAVAPSTPGAGLPPARARLAASLRGDLRPRRAGTRARLLAVRDGAAEPPRGGLRVRAHAARLRLPLGAGAGAHGGGAGHGRGTAVARTCRTGSSAATPPATSASIVAIVKTQGSDTKLVAQMQPWYEAQSLGRDELAGAPCRRWSRRSPTARTAA